MFELFRRQPNSLEAVFYRHLHKLTKEAASIIEQGGTANAGSIRNKLKAVMALTQNPEYLFSSNLVENQLGTFTNIYAHHDENWYRLNRENVERSRKAVSNYFKALSRHFKRNDNAGIVEATKVFFNELYLLAGNYAYGTEIIGRHECLPVPK